MELFDMVAMLSNVSVAKVEKARRYCEERPSVSFFGLMSDNAFSYPETSSIVAAFVENGMLVETEKADVYDVVPEEDWESLSDKREREMAKAAEVLAGEEKRWVDLMRSRSRAELVDFLNGSPKKELGMPLVEAGVLALEDDKYVVKMTQEEYFAFYEAVRKNAQEKERPTYHTRPSIFRSDDENDDYSAYLRKEEEEARRERMKREEEARLAREKRERREAKKDADEEEKKKNAVEDLLVGQKLGSLKGSADDGAKKATEEDAKDKKAEDETEGKDHRLRYDELDSLPDGNRETIDEILDELEALLEEENDTEEEDDEDEDVFDPIEKSRRDFDDEDDEDPFDDEQPEDDDDPFDEDDDELSDDDEDDEGPHFPRGKFDDLDRYLPDIIDPDFEELQKRLEESNKRLRKVAERMRERRAAEKVRRETNEQRCREIETHLQGKGVDVKVSMERADNFYLSTTDEYGSFRIVGRFSGVGTMCLTDDGDGWDLYQKSGAKKSERYYELLREHHVGEIWSAFARGSRCVAETADNYAEKVYEFYLFIKEVRKLAFSDDDIV